MIKECDKFRFISKIDKSPQGREFDSILYPYCNNDCWRYTGYIGSEGYGYFQLNSQCKLAHRISYIIYNGDIPDKMQIRHICDNKWCINPNHLLLGTSQDDANDRKARDNHRIGSEVNTAILNEENVKQILTDVYNDKYDTIEEICQIYKISTVSMRKIFTGNNWKCVTRDLQVPLSELYQKIYKPTKGETHHSASLTIDIVKEIKQLLITETISSISVRYNISNTAVSNIKNGKSWKSVI